MGYMKKICEDWLYENIDDTDDEELEDMFGWTEEEIQEARMIFTR